MRILSASSWPRGWVCPASLALPWLSETSETSSDGRPGPRAKGSAKHLFLETLFNTGDLERATEVVDDDETREECRDIDVSKMEWMTVPEANLTYEAEMAFAWDVVERKVRYLGKSIGRAYKDVKDTEVVGSFDIVGHFNQHVLVVDYKCGFGAEGYTDAAKNNIQLKIGALCAAEHYGKKDSRVAILHIEDSGRVTEDSATLFRYDLDWFADELEEKFHKVRLLEEDIARGLTPDVTRGPHCRYCRAAHCCPGSLALVREMSGASGALAAIASGSITPEVATAAYRRLKEVEQSLRSVRGALASYARNCAIDVTDDTVYGPHIVRKLEIDAEAAKKVVAEMLGPEAAEKCCNFDTSKAAIERGVKVGVENIRMSGRNATVAATLREVMKRLNELGAVRQKETVKVEEHKVKENK